MLLHSHKLKQIDLHTPTVFMALILHACAVALLFVIPFLPSIDGHADESWIAIYWNSELLDILQQIQGGGDVEIRSAVSSAGRGSFFLGLIKSSAVTPLPSFVIPMTAGSPFLTNSYWP